MAKSKLIKYNIKNVKYAVKDESGVWGNPIDLAYANSLSLEANFSETKFFGDGEVIAVLTNDKGKTGTLSVINIEHDYEIACGRMMEIEGGFAEIEQISSVEHCLYYEVDAKKDGVPITIKTWMFGCITGKANESYQQTQEDHTVNTYDYPLTVNGVNLKASTGENDYVDANGNTIKVPRKFSYPTDQDYATFGNAVPIPKAKVEI